MLGAVAAAAAMPPLPRMIATLVAEILDIGSSRIPAVDIIEKAARLEEEVDRQLEDAAWLGDQANKVQLCK